MNWHYLSNETIFYMMVLSLNDDILPVSNRTVLNVVGISLSNC